MIENKIAQKMAVALLATRLSPLEWRSTPLPTFLLL